jgi:pyruvate/2-oxoacid:ferredoxin oxidoreductase alpha subunit
MRQGMPGLGHYHEGGILMTKRVGMEVSVAIGEMVKMADVDVIAAYPITPSWLLMVSWMPNISQ